jgi:hypothetical protein
MQIFSSVELDPPPPVLGIEYVNVPGATGATALSVGSVHRGLACLQSSSLWTTSTRQSTEAGHLGLLLYRCRTVLQMKISFSLRDISWSRRIAVRWDSTSPAYFTSNSSTYLKTIRVGIQPCGYCWTTDIRTVHGLADRQVQYSHNI